MTCSVRFILSHPDYRYTSRLLAHRIITHSVLGVHQTLLVIRLHLQIAIMSVLFLFAMSLVAL